MSPPSKQSRFIVALVGSLIVVAATWMVRHPSDALRTTPSRAPSSIQRGNRMENQKKVRVEEFAKFEAAGKVTGNFTVAIRGDDRQGAPIDGLSTAASHFRLTGTIAADRPILAHEYTWILPKGYEAPGGGLTGKIPNLEAGQSYEVSIVIDRGQTPLQPIALHVFKLVDSEARGQIAQFDIPEAKSLKETNVHQGRMIDPDTKYVQ